MNISQEQRVIKSVERFEAIEKRFSVLFLRVKDTVFAPLSRVDDLEKDMKDVNVKQSKKITALEKKVGKIKAILVKITATDGALPAVKYNPRTDSFDLGD